MSEEVATTPAEVVDSGTATEPSTTKGPEAFRDRATEALEQVKANNTLSEQVKGADSISIDSIPDDALPTSEDTFKGLDYNAIIESLPEDAKKLVSNLRKDYTRKTQEISAQRKELEVLQNSIVGSEWDKSIEAMSNSETVELDPYSTESFEQRIQQEVARRMNEMMAPLRQEQAYMRKKQQLDQFKTDNPDLQDYKSEIVEMLKSNQSLSLQDAYYIAKGKATNEQLRQAKTELQQHRENARAFGLKVGKPSVGIEKPPKGLNSYEVYKWLQARKK